MPEYADAQMLTATGSLRLEGLAELETGNDGPVVAFRHTTDDYQARGVVSREANGLVISHIDIDPTPGRAGLTVAMLREVPVREIIAMTQNWMSAIREIGAEKFANWNGASDPNVLNLETVEKPRPGRAPITDEQLREIALLYLEETAPGKPRGAIQRIAKRKNMAAPTVSRWVGRAREGLWLGPAVPGREGGEAGPRLVAAEVRAVLDRFIGPEGPNSE